MKAIGVAAFVATGGFAAADKPDYNDMWGKFKVDHNKYFPENGIEEQKRFDIFKANVDIIEAHNAKQLSYTLGVNAFADLTWEEFASTHLGYNGGRRFGNLPNQLFANITSVADSIDWVVKGAVTPVKNQQQCGSCWAFSTTGALEGAYFVASGKLESLSEEDLVQCDHNGDQGCNGGLMDNAFEWVSQNGICSESAYPYTSGGGTTGTCQTGCSPVMTITGHTDVPSQDEDALKAAVSKQPVSVAIEADKSAFQLYSGGVLDSTACGTSLDHGVLIVGYGTDGKDYWKVKNSWGATWGEQGYIRMARGKNMCGIAQEPSYPIGAKAVGPSPSPGPSPPSPPSPTPPSPPSPPSASHYEQPPCQSDEMAGDIYYYYELCAPHCDGGAACPTAPAGTTATPACVLSDTAGDQFCALTCDTSSVCPAGATCTFSGICAYPSTSTVADASRPKMHKRAASHSTVVV